MSGEPSTLTRILVVDDSKLILKAAQRMLGAEFDVITAVDGVDAWDRLERDTTIQVVFTDLDMPNSDGYELLRKVRTAAEPGLQSMPVIVVTGANDDDSARLKSLHLGATDFITKPFSSTDLLARARVHAKYQRITKQLQAQSTLDPLTGLANKRGFLDRLQQDIAYARRHQQAIAVTRVEIDDLRTIFLKRGKGVAEQMVMHVANLIRARIRKEDTAARVGLGGFAISLPGGHLEGSEEMRNWLHAEVAAHPPEVDGEPLPIALSTAVIGAELQHWPNAQEALDRCEALLESAPARPGMLSAPSTAPQPRRAAAVPTQTAPGSPPRESAAAQEMSAPELLRLDPLLDQVKQGHTQEAIAKMPQVMQRLAPLLRLLTANQRAQLIRFLEKLGGV
jgi:diguanylate cyclase (GGDEF)-like protein